MANRTYPTDSVDVSEFSYRLFYNQQVNVSPYSGQVRSEQRDHPRWEGQATFLIMGAQGDERDRNAQIWQNFLSSLGGPTHTFDLPHYLNPLPNQIRLVSSEVVDEKIEYAVSSIRGLAVGQWGVSNGRRFVVDQIKNNKLILLPNVALPDNSNLDPTNVIRVRITNLPSSLRFVSSGKKFIYERISLEWIESI